MIINFKIIDRDNHVFFLPADMLIGNDEDVLNRQLWYYADLIIDKTNRTVVKCRLF